MWAWEGTAVLGAWALATARCVSSFWGASLSMQRVLNARAVARETFLQICSFYPNGYHFWKGDNSIRGCSSRCVVNAKMGWKMLVVLIGCPLIYALEAPDPEKGRWHPSRAWYQALPLPPLPHAKEQRLTQVCWPSYSRAGFSLSTPPSPLS